ncbi:MAG TPA: VWA domain-containing protein, partial [Blastocatellia bacterium]
QTLYHHPGVFLMQTQRHLVRQLLCISVVFIVQMEAAAVFGDSNGSSPASPDRGSQQQNQGSAPQTKNPQPDQDADKNAQSSAQLTLSTSEVVLDVVVRDKKGNAVKDLSASDFEVSEDGKKQEIESFRLHDQPAVPETKPGPSGTPATDRTTLQPGPTQNPFAGINVVALVFDRLDLQGRIFAQKAALKCVSDTFSRNDFAGIFSIDLTLRILQPFTNNKDLISSAISSMTVDNSKNRPNGQPAGTAVADYLANVTAGGFAGVPEAGNNLSTNPADQAAAGLTANVASAFTTLQRNQQSYAEIYSLLAIVNSLRGIEGRKAVIVFSEGLSITSDTADNFRSLISSANRANVTFYTIDAAGLRAHSPTAATARRLNNLANRRANASLNGTEDQSGHPMTFDLENNETLLNLDPSSGLTRLADQTGGFLINGTNNLDPGLTRIGQDIRSYYVLSYAPENQQYDGKFRKISVKVNRPGLDVETRKGYYAIHKPNPMPVSDWESAPLAVLKGGGNENALTMRAKVFNFPEPAKPGLVPVMVEVPARSLTYEVDKEKNIYKADFSIEVLVKDLSDQVVAKVGNHYQISGPAGKLEEAKRGDILFYRETDLDPGLYFVEAVAYDAPTAKASTRSTSVEVPYNSIGEAPRLSSIIVLRSAEQAPASKENENNPFRYGSTLVYPNMGEPLSRSRNKQLAFYFDVYPAKRGGDPKLTIEILRNNEPVTSGSPALGAPDETGRIQFVSALPLSGFQPGDYSLKITITQGEASVSRVASFTVQP